MQAGSAADLDHAIAAFQQATSSTSNQASLDPDTLNRLGNALRDRYDHTGSLHDLNEAIICFRETMSSMPESSQNYAGSLQNLGIALRTRFEINGSVQDLNEALDCLQRAVELMSDDDAYRASCMNSLGNSFRERYQRTRDVDDLARARQWYVKAIERAQDNLEEQAMYLSNLGIALVDKFLDTHDPADLDQAVLYHQHAVQQTPATDSQHSVRLAYRGNALSERYKSRGSAEDIQQAIADWQQALESVSPTAPIRVTYLNNLGNGFYWRGDKTGNASDLQTATEYYRKAVSEGMDANRETALASAQSWGQLAYRQQDWSAAVEAYRAAIQVLDKILASQQERSAKQSWLRDAQLLYPRAAYALARHGELQTAVATLESGRARLLAEALLQNIIGESHLSFEQICTILTQTTREGIESIGVYFIVSPVGSAAFVIHRKGVEPVWLDITEPELNQFLVTWQGTKPTGYLPAQMGLDSVAAILDTMLPVVGQCLIGPLVSALEHLWENGTSNERCLILIPAGRLAELPLHAAPYASDGGQRTLLDRFTVVYVPSARVRDHSAQILQQQPLEQPSVLAIGNPLPLPPGYASLDFAAVELAVVADRFGNHAVTVLEEQATRAAVMDSLGKTTYLHFSSHGEFDPENPLESGVVLSQGEKLTLGDLLSISTLRRTRLAVLSACQTAISDFNRTPDEMIGLLSGFLQAGIPGVVGSLWPVNDLSTALFMIKFYEFHLKGDKTTGEAPMNPAGALRKAQLWLREATAQEMALADYWEQLNQTSARRDANAYRWMRYYRAHPDARPYVHPYYWAAFTVTGM
jgi:CHAT domain-containing protein/tetratricopeptide (TPR) repeat protein